MLLMASAIAAIASAPFHGLLAWAVIPVMVSSNQVLPLWATWIWPSVGSVSRIQSFFVTHPALIAASTPRIKSSSSTEQIMENGFSGSSPLSPTFFTIFLKAVKAQARPDFISQAPRPYIFPSRIIAPSGEISSSQPSPSMTVSIWQI